MTNIYKIQACDSMLCGHFCSRFIDFMLKDKSLLVYWQNNHKIFSIIKKIKLKKSIALFVVIIEKLKTEKYYNFLNKY